MVSIKWYALTVGRALFSGMDANTFLSLDSFLTFPRFFL
jgi:hypothetical protein